MMLWGRYITSVLKVGGLAGVSGRTRGVSDLHCPTREEGVSMPGSWTNETSAMAGTIWTA